MKGFSRIKEFLTYIKDEKFPFSTWKVFAFIILFVTITGVSYSFFNATISGNNSAKQNEVKAGNLSIKFTNTNKIDEENATPGWSEAKTFTVENDGDYETSYYINFASVINELVNNEALTYTLVGKNENNTEIARIENETLPSTGNHINILGSKKIAAGKTHTYTLTIKYASDAEQESDINKEIQTKLEVLSGDGTFEKGNITITLNSATGGQLKAEDTTQSTNSVANSNGTNTLTAKKGDHVKVTAIPNAGYKLNTLKQGTENISNNYSFTASENKTFNATWILTQRTVNVIVYNGTVDPSSKRVNYGSSDTFTITPTIGYGNPTVTCTNSQSASISGNTLTVSNVTADTTCSVTYNAKKYNLVATNSQNILTNGTFGNYTIVSAPAKTANGVTHTWDGSLNGIPGDPTKAYSASSWGTGANMGVPVPEIGYHAHVKIIDGNPVFDYKTNETYNGKTDANVSGGVSVTPGTVTTSRWLGTSQSITGTTFTPGKTYQITLDVYRVSGTAYSTAGLYYATNANPTNSFVSGTPSFTPTTTGSWETISKTFVLSTDYLNTKNPSFYIYGYGPGELYVDNVRLEEVETKTSNKSYNSTFTSSELASQTKTGYSFSNWYNNYQNQTQLSTSKSFNTTNATFENVNTENTNAYIYPKWTANTYTVSATINGGTLSGSTTKTISYTNQAEFTINPSTGYLMNGATVSCTNSQSASISGNTLIVKNVTNNTTCTVTLSKNAYTISYNLDGGSVSTANPTSYTVESSAITLNNPTKTGYTFAGWTGTGLTSATKTVTIPKGSTGNRSYAATWTVNSYSCDAGKYLASGATSCTACTAGNYCPGGSYNYNTSSNQGINACPSADSGWTRTSPASSDNYDDCYEEQTPTNCSSGKVKRVASSTTTYSSTKTVSSTLSAQAKYYVNGTSCTACTEGYYCTGGTANKVACAVGSYSTATSSTCTACAAGKTTSGTASTSSSACTTCSNSSNVSAWGTQTWSANSVSNLCVINSCNTGYTKSGSSPYTCNINKYTVNVTVNNGTVNTSSKTVNHGSSGTFTITPSTGYGSPTVTCTNSQSASISGNTLTISNVTNNTTCSVTYNKNSYTLTMNPNGGSWNGTTSNTTVTKKYQETYDVTNNATRSGYVFNGWKLTSGKGDITWFKDSDVLTSYKITSASSSKPSVYNNSSGGAVTHQIISDSTSSTGYSVKITTNGTASPGAGGFYNNTTSVSGAFFYHKIVAKVPSGYTLEIASNSRGIGAGQYWLTDNTGDGTWKTYIYVTPCGINGSFSSFGHVYASGSNNTSVTWYLQESTMYKISSSLATTQATTMGFKFLDSNATLTAQWNASGSRVTFNANNGTFASGTTTAMDFTYTSAYTSEKKAPYYIDSSTYNISRTGYTFKGWYTAATGGTQVFNAKGQLNASVSGYSDASRVWQKYDQNITLYAQWETNSYTITINSGTGGSTKVEDTTKGTSATATSGGSTTLTVNYGDTIKVTATPNTGYNLSTLKHGSTSISSGGTYTYNITSGETVSSTFTLKQYTVNVTVNNGTVVGSTTKTVNHGSSTSFTFTPTTGYGSLTIVGTCTGGSISGNTLTISNVTSNQTCTVTFNKPPAATTLISKSPTTTGTINTDGLMKVSQPATGQTPALTEYRYSGSNVKNYVTFNGEPWRIIGVFSVDDGTGNYEQRVKIMRNASIGDYSWDSSSSTVNDGYGINEWSQADLKTELNGTYYNYGLSSTAQNMIDNAKWYTSSYDPDGATSSTAYTYERASTTRQCGTFSAYDCSGESVRRTTNWTGKIALAYPSDYGYASSGCYAGSMDIFNYEDSTCTSTNWMFNGPDQWFLSPYSDYANTALIVNGAGYVDIRDASYAIAVRPVTYLKSNIVITGGSGTSSDPYTLG